MNETRIVKVNRPIYVVFVGETGQKVMCGTITKAVDNEWQYEQKDDVSLKANQLLSIINKLNELNETGEIKEY